MAVVKTYRRITFVAAQQFDSQNPPRNLVNVYSTSDSGIVNGKLTRLPNAWWCDIGNDSYRLNGGEWLVSSFLTGRVMEIHKADAWPPPQYEEVHE